MIYDLITTVCQEQLHSARWELENLLSDRKVELADLETVENYVEDLRNLLEENPLADRKSFIKSFVREVRVTGSEVLLTYNIPLSASSSSQETLIVPPIVHDGGGGTGLEPVTSAMSRTLSSLTARLPRQTSCSRSPPYQEGSSFIPAVASTPTSTLTSV